MEWDIAKARKNISYVAQDTYLFEGTVAQNIAYGKPNASFDEITQAAEKAYAHDFIMSMPDGYQTVLSERGTNISGGQKQRIAIARAFLKDAPIFLLDEMTSALDVESEKLIQRAIENYSESKTVILIAHRLSTIINADEIYVLSDGVIAENGTHEGLLEKKGIYTMLYSNQVLSNVGEQDA
jgi:ABC-type multidrug transport system fused ATPase/permease subunit